MGGRADWGWVDFCSDEEGDGIGTELIEERGEEVHGLEFLDVFDGCVTFEVEGRDDEENEIHEETYHLHTFASVEFVVYEECLKWRVSRS